MNNVLPSTARRAVAMLAPLLAALLLISGSAALAAPAGAADAATGWIRLAHLSPNAPAVDVYLYNFGNPAARVVLHHVSYGTVSPYEQVPAGEYTVSMRAAGARGSAKPILSTGFEVNRGRAYTVAGMGPAAGLRLQVIDDTITAPAGHALVRVIQASLSQHVVTVSLGHLTLHQLDFASVSTYRTVAAGHDQAKVTGNSERASMNMPVPADSIHTLVVLDGSKGLRLTDLEDAAGSQVAPAGGAATGLGGTAPRPAPAPWPWLAVIVAGALLSLAGARRFRAARASSSQRT